MRMLRPCAVAAFAVSGCVASVARAQTDPGFGTAPPGYVAPAYVPPAYPPISWTPPPRRRWYGWQTLTVDGAALGLFVLAAQNGREPVVSIAVGTGLATILLGAPAVHWAHGRVGVGFLSLGLRVALPALAGYLLSGGPCLGGSECSLDVVLGLGLLATPIVIDAAVLAREPVSLAEPATVHEPVVTVAGLTLEPSIALLPEPRGHRALAVVSGRW